MLYMLVHQLKKIGSRFDDETIDKLLNIKWWDKDESWIAKNADKFKNPVAFVKEFSEQK